jgi:hypothetical protein
METAFQRLLTTAHRPAMEAYISNHPESFEEAIRLAISDKKPYSWRAAWLLWSCMEKNDKRIRKHVRDIINVLPAREDSQKRELLKILEQMEINQAFEGLLFKQCEGIWKSVEKKPTVRLYAFKILGKIAGRHPELRRELIFLTQEIYTDNLSSPARKSIDKIVKEVS